MVVEDEILEEFRSMVKTSFYAWVGLPEVRFVSGEAFKVILREEFFSGAPVMRFGKFSPFEFYGLLLNTREKELNDLVGQDFEGLSGQIGFRGYLADSWGRIRLSGRPFLREPLSKAPSTSQEPL